MAKTSPFLHFLFGRTPIDYCFSLQFLFSIFFFEIKKSNNNNTIREKSRCSRFQSPNKGKYFTLFFRKLQCITEIKRKRISVEQIEWKYPVAKCLHTRTVKSDTRNSICKSMSLFEILALLFFTYKLEQRYVK